MSSAPVLMLGSPTAPQPAAHTPRVHRRASGPAQLDVLLLDAQYRQTLACMRSFARSGLRVGAVACEPDAWWAPSFRSRWCSLSAVVPDFSLSADAYVDALLALLNEHPARMLLPAHDGSIEVLRARRAEIERRVALPLAHEAALDIAVSKSRTMALAAEMGIAVPRSIPVTCVDDVRAALDDVGLPAVIKPVQSWVERDGVGTRLTSGSVLSVEDAKKSLDYILSAGGQAVLQPWLPGRREAVSLFYAHGRFWARFAQVSHREWPTLGGVSVLCESIPLLPDITEPAERLVQAIGLEGCSMVEFRRDREGRPVLMEINPRIAGSVALAISAGVDFPTLLHDWALGGTLREVVGYRTGRRLRWLGGDIWNLKCVFDSQGQLDVPPCGRAVTTFLSDFVLRPSAFDLVELGDMRPALIEMRKTVLLHAQDRIRKSFPMSRLLPSRKV